MPGIMDVHVATFQLRSELMINHFKQLIIIYKDTVGRVEKNSAFEVTTRKIVICDPVDKDLSRNCQGSRNRCNSLLFGCEQVKNTVTNPYPRGII